MLGGHGVSHRIDNVIHLFKLLGTRIVQELLCCSFHLHQNGRSILGNTEDRKLVTRRSINTIDDEMPQLGLRDPQDETEEFGEDLFLRPELGLEGWTVQTQGDECSKNI